MENRLLNTFIFMIFLILYLKYSKRQALSYIGIVYFFIVMHKYAYFLNWNQCIVYWFAVLYL